MFAIWQALENCLGQAWILYPIFAVIHSSHQKEAQGTKLLIRHSLYYIPVAWLLGLRWISKLMSAFFRYTSENQEDTYHT